MTDAPITPEPGTGTATTSGGGDGPASTGCPLCGALVVDDGRHGDRANGYWLCFRCRSLLPEPSRSTIEVVGPPEPTVIDEAGSGGPADPAHRLAWELAEHLAPPTESRAVVDLGAGRGRLLHALGELGYPVRGCEPSARLCQMARAAFLIGPDVLFNESADGYLDALEIEGGPFAGFVLIDVIHHHPDPAGLLRRCRDLAPGGLLFLSVPVATGSTPPPGLRCLPTPASIVELARDLRLAVIDISVAGDTGLRVFLRPLDPDVVDLDATDDPDIDVESLEAAYRAVSPAFALHVPAPDHRSVVPAEGVERAEGVELGHPGS